MIFLAVAPRTGELLCSQGQYGHSRSGRGTQVVRERSAKPLCVGSIPTRASINPVAELQDRSSIVFEISAWMLLMQRARRVSGLALLATISDQLVAALQNR